MQCMSIDQLSKVLALVGTILGLLTIIGGLLAWLYNNLDKRRQAILLKREEDYKIIITNIRSFGSLTHSHERTGLFLRRFIRHGCLVQMM